MTCVQVDLGPEGCKNSEVHLGSSLILLLFISQIQIFVDLCQKCPHEPEFIHSSPNPLLSKHPQKLPHSYITDKETSFLHRLSKGTPFPVCVDLRYSSNLIPPRPSRSICSLPVESPFHKGRYHARWVVEQPPHQSARCARRCTGHSFSFCPPTSPGRSLTVQAQTPRQCLGRGWHRRACRGRWARAWGQSRCPEPRLRPESNPPPHAPIRGAPRPPHLCARPRSQLRSRRGPPCPPWQLGPRPWPGRLEPALRPEQSTHDVS